MAKSESVFFPHSLITKGYYTHLILVTHTLTMIGQSSIWNVHTIMFITYISDPPSAKENRIERNENSINYSSGRRRRYTVDRTENTRLSLHLSLSFKQTNKQTPSNTSNESNLIICLCIQRSTN